MRELSYQECMEIEGGKLSTVILGLGITLVGVALVASTAATFPVICAGVALVEVGKAVTIGGAFER